MTHEELQAEVQRLAALAGHWELMYHRAAAGAQAANVGLRRAQKREYRARIDYILANGRAERFERQVAEATKKIERLSLKILELWGRE